MFPTHKSTYPNHTSSYRATSAGQSSGTSATRKDASTKVGNFLHSASQKCAPSITVQEACLYILNEIKHHGMSEDVRKDFLDQLANPDESFEDKAGLFKSETVIPVIKSAAYSLKRESEAEKTLHGSIQGKTHFSNIAPSDYWRLIIDGASQSDDPNGKYVFENEPGYLAGGLSGFSRMLTTLERPLDVELFTSLHDYACGGVMEIDCTYPGKEITKGITGRIVVFGAIMCDDFSPNITGSRAVLGAIIPDGYVFTPTVSVAGLSELLTSKHENSLSCFLVGNASEDGKTRYEKIDDLESDISIEKVRNASSLLLGRPVKSDPEQCKASCATILEKYKQDIQNVEDDGDSKLAVIAECCRALENEHVFEDGNARTVGILVLNKLLIQNGLTPSIMRDPNVFDGYSIKELCDEIKQGQSTFQALANP